MGNVPLRRFIDLEVHEVSLVDSPANEKEFAVLKRMEEDMPSDVKEVIEKEATSNDEKLEEVAEEKVTEENVEVEKVESKEAADPEKVVNEAVEKALEKVTGLIDSIAKKANEKNEETPVKKEEPAEEKAEEAEKEVEETKEEKEEEVEEKPEGVEKAKRFTPRRIQALMDATTTLQSLVGEIAESLEPPQEETTKSEGDVVEDVMKSLNTSISELKETFKQFAETQKSLSERIDAIEKIRQPSQSVEDDGGTDSKVKKDTNLWKGLL